MQQEAVRRVREMQARAQHLRPEPAQRREPPEPEPSHQHGERSHERREQPSMPPVPLGPPKPPAEGIFKSLMRDSDQTLILILLLLLLFLTACYFLKKKLERATEKKIGADETKS